MIILTILYDEKIVICVLKWAIVRIVYFLIIVMEQKAVLIVMKLRVVRCVMNL